MQAAAKLGIAISVGQIGGGLQSGGEGPQLQSADGVIHKWLTTTGPDEDALIHQLRAALMQDRNLGCRIVS